MTGRKRLEAKKFAGHAAIINEYDWGWLHRDGTPTTLTRKVFEHVLGKQSTAAERLEWSAYSPTVTRRKVTINEASRGRGTKGREIRSGLC